MKPRFKTALVTTLRFLGIPAISLVSLFLLAAYWSKSSYEPEITLKYPKINAPSQLPAPKISEPPLSSLKPPQPKIPQPPNSPGTVKETPTKIASKGTKKEITSKTSSHKPKPALEAPQSIPQAKLVEATPVNLDIRVAVLRDADYTVLGISGQGTISDRHGQILQTLAASQGVNITPNGNHLTVGDAKLPPVVWVQVEEGSVIYLGDRWYRGKILLVSQGNSLLAVNYVNLEEYLYSVVGSEMHADAPTEALKAQAIAARSYALVHIIRPASPWYDLGNTQRWQVYKGLNSEYNTSQNAVNQTMGQILSYQGGVVESLYAATDEIVARAHSGRGMSQTGAYELARQGYDHQRILNHYYPGVTLARIILNNSSLSQ